MKKSPIVAILFFAMAASGFAQANDKTSEESEYLNDAKLSFSRPLTAPTKNKDAQKAYNTGCEFLDDGKYNEAEEYFLTAIELDPEYVDAMDHLGIIFRRQKRFTDAEKIYLLSISINPANPVPYQNLALVYRNMNKMEKAIEWYIKLGELDADDPESYYGLGEVLQKLEDFLESKKFFDIAIEKYKKIKSDYIFDAYYYQGINCYMLQEYNKALEYFNLARRAYPDSTQLKELILEIKEILDRPGNV